MKRKIFSVLFAVVLVVGMSLVTAVPAGAEDGPPDAIVFPFELGGQGSYTAEWSTTPIKSGSSSVHLQTTGTVGAGDEARILIDLSDLPEGEELFLGDIESISWWVYAVAGYPAHLDITLDTADPFQSMLTAEPEYNNAHGQGATYSYNKWLKTFELTAGDGYGEIGDSTMLWVTKMGAGNTDAPWGTLANWKDSVVANDPGKELAVTEISSDTVVLSLEIEVDNWVVQSEAFVDDITVNGILICGQIQDAIDSVDPSAFIFVAAGTYNEDVTVNMNLTLVGAQFGVDPRGGRAGDESEIVGVVVVTSAATNVVFDGFKFTSPTRAFNPRGFNLGIESASSTIRNNILVAEENEGHVPYGSYLTFKDITNALVEQNSFSGHLDLTQRPNVILFFGIAAGIVTVQNNEMRDVGGGGGIGIMCGNAAAVVNIDGNEIENTGNECIWVWNPGGSAFATLSITSNELSEATLNGIKFEAPITGVVSVSDNEFWDNPVQVLDSAEILDIQAVLNTNTFDRAVVVDHASLLHTIWSKIQDGIDNASSGDSVIVAAGTYNEAVVVNKNLTLLGAQHGVDPTAGTRTDVAAESIMDSVTAGCWTISITASGVKVDGFTATSSGSVRCIDIMRGLGENSNATITNNIISNGAGVGLSIWDESDGNTIANNIISGHACEGMWVNGSSNNIIKNNIVSNNNAADTDPPTKKAAGIQVNHSHNNTLTGNTVSGQYSGINLCSAYGSSEGNTITQNNTILDNSGHGICIYGGNENTGAIITNNTIEGNKKGISVYDAASNNVAHNNNIVGNTEYGVYNGTISAVDATDNWWGNVTGPKHTTLNTGAQGNAVSGKVAFSPWLYKTQEKFISGAPCYAGSVVLSNKAAEVETGSYAGGWNSFSTPVALVDSADSVSELLALLTADGRSSIVRAQRFDPIEQIWVILVMGETVVDYQINPGEGFFIQVSTEGSLPILCLTTPTTSPPMTNLVAGWNLVGLSNFRGMAARKALYNVDYSVVISPSPPNAVSWSLPSFGPTFMRVGEAYWLGMGQPGILFGHTTTPVADDLTWDLNHGIGSGN